MGVGSSCTCGASSHLDRLQLSRRNTDQSDAIRLNSPSQEHRQQMTPLNEAASSSSIKKSASHERGQSYPSVNPKYGYRSAVSEYLDLEVPNMQNRVMSFDSVLKAAMTIRSSVFLNHLERRLGIIILKDICDMICRFLPDLDDRFANFPETAANGIDVTAYFDEDGFRSEGRLKVMFDEPSLAYFSNGRRTVTKVVFTNGQIISFALCDVECIVPDYSQRSDTDQSCLCLSIIGDMGERLLNIKLRDEKLFHLWLEGLNLLLLHDQTKGTKQIPWWMESVSEKSQK